jgi:hypothetical protein
MRCRLLASSENLFWEALLAYLKLIDCVNIAVTQVQGANV